MTSAIDIPRAPRRPYEPRPKPISRDAELELVARAQQTEDVPVRNAARKQLMTLHTPYVWQMAHKFGRKSLRFDAGDFASAGVIGMEACIDKFDPTKGANFLSYATWWIRAYMFRLIRRRGHEKNVLLLSLQTPVAAFDSGGEYTLEDNLACNSESQEELAVRADDARQAEVKVHEALKGLHPRLRHIIQRRHLDEDWANLADIGREMGLSRERVRQLERDALLNLKRALETIPTST